MVSKPHKVKSAPRKSVSKKRSGSRKPGPKVPAKKPIAHPMQVHALKGSQFAKLTWDARSKGYVGDLIGSEEASALTSNQHPPKVIPIRNDPNHVILYLWDASKNEYDQGETVSVNDPRLPGNS
jgi:hypothetical protein